MPAWKEDGGSPGDDWQASLAALYYECRSMMQPHAKTNLSEERDRFNGMCLSPEGSERVFSFWASLTSIPGCEWPLSGGEGAQCGSWADLYLLGIREETFHPKIRPWWLSSGTRQGHSKAVEIAFIYILF